MALLVKALLAISCLLLEFWAVKVTVQLEYIRVIFFEIALFLVRLLATRCILWFFLSCLSQFLVKLVDHLLLLARLVGQNVKLLLEPTILPGDVNKLILYYF